MLRFAVGIDRRSGAFGADLERHLRVTYDMADFVIEGYNGTLPLTSIRSVANQTDCLLQALYEYPARYYIALATGRVVKNTVVGPIPDLVTVLTAIDTDGLVLYDSIQTLGHWLPPSQRKYTAYKPPDLLDFVSEVIDSLLKPQLHHV
jgi:hypothetical protein